MGYLLQILCAMGAVAAAELGVATGWRQPLAVLAAAFVPHALAFLARRAHLAGRFRRAGWLARAVSLWPVPGQVFALLVCGWLDSLASWTGGTVSILGWPTPALLLTLVPYAVYQVIAIDAVARLADGSREGRRRIAILQLRIFASSLLPIVLFIVVASLIGLSDVLRVNIEEVALWNAVFSTVLVVLFALFLPTLLRNTWETVRLGPGAERRLLLDVARRAGFVCRDLLLWKTGHLMANAAIVGLTKKSRVVLFSDSLLSQLSPRELAAVFAHEIGHAARHHVPIFVMWAVGFFMCIDLALTHVAPTGAWWDNGLILAALVGWYYAFGFLSRRFELEADLYSLELLGDPEALIDALERVGGRLRDIASWRHFSTVRRVQFIAEAARSRAVGDRLRRTLRIARWCSVALFVVAGGVELYTMLHAWPKSRVYVDLRLGHYAEAAARLDDGLEVEPPLAALVARAAALDERDPARLEAEAREALTNGRGDVALLTLELAVLRGREDLRPVARALRTLLLDQAAEDGGRDDAAVDEHLAPDWRGELERFAARRAQ